MPAPPEDPAITSNGAKTKTYNRRDSQMVTHSSTNRPVQCLCMAERTGCPVFTDLWSYVTVPTQLTLYTIALWLACGILDRSKREERTCSFRSYHINTQNHSISGTEEAGQTFIVSRLFVASGRMPDGQLTLVSHLSKIRCFHSFKLCVQEYLELAIAI